MRARQTASGSLGRRGDARVFEPGGCGGDAGAEMIGRVSPISKSDIDSLMLCVAGAWLYGTISGGRARELAQALGRTAQEVENLKFVEQCAAEAEAQKDIPDER
jgi:hypothetical protein